MRSLLSFAALFVFAFTTIGQSVPDKDTSTIDGIVKAVYEVISGDAGEKRDWDRFRKLFHKDAKLIPTGTNPQTKLNVARPMSPEDYITRNEPFFMQNGFHEREIARRTDEYGAIAHVFTTYEAFKTKADKKPFMRGINSMQLFNDGQRWWVMSIFWQAETPELQLPKKYLKSQR